MSKVSIYVRRGGPNYQEGLKVMKNCGDMLGVAMHVFGPEIHMTAIVGMALGKTPGQTSFTFTFSFSFTLTLTFKEIR